MEGGLAVYEVASHGFSIGVPPEWRVVSVDEALPEAEREELAREHPDLAPVLEALSSGDRPIKLFGFDPEVRDGFATNVNVLTVDVPGSVRLEEFVEANEADLEQFGDRIRDVRSTREELPAGPAGRLDYELRLSEAQAVATRQHLVLGEGGGYIVTFSTLPQLREEYAGTFDRIVRSLRLDEGD